MPATSTSGSNANNMGKQDLDTIYAYKCNMTYMQSQNPAEKVANYTTVWAPWYNTVDWEFSEENESGQDNKKHALTMICNSSGLNWMVASWAKVLTYVQTLFEELVRSGILDILKELDAAFPAGDPFPGYLNDYFESITDFLDADLSFIGYLLAALFDLLQGYDGAASSSACTVLMSASAML